MHYSPKLLSHFSPKRASEILRSLCLREAHEAGIIPLKFHLETRTNGRGNERRSLSASLRGKKGRERERKREWGREKEGKGIYRDGPPAQLAHLRPNVVYIPHVAHGESKTCRLRSFWCVLTHGANYSFESTSRPFEIFDLTINSTVSQTTSQKHFGQPLTH